MNLRAAFVFSLAVALTMAGCTDFLSPVGFGAPGTVVGCFEDAAGVPLPDVVVWPNGLFRSAALTTGVDGRFRFESMDPGPTQFTARSADGMSRVFDTYVVPNRTVSLACIRLEEPGCLGGRITHEDGGIAPPVEVLVGDTALWAWTRADGTFEIEVPAGRRYDLLLQSMNIVTTTVSSQLIGANGNTGCSTSGPTYAVAWTDTPEPFDYVELPPMPVGVFDAAAAVDGTTFHLAGGYRCVGTEGCPTKQFGTFYNDTFQTFSFRDGLWTNRPEKLPTPRTGARGGFLGGKFYVVGGRVTGSGTGGLCSRLLASAEECPGSQRCQACYLDTVERWDPLRGIWEGASDGVAQLEIVEKQVPPAVPTKRALEIGWGTMVTTPNALIYVGGISNGLDGYHSQPFVLRDDAEGWIGSTFRTYERVYVPWACAAGDSAYLFGGEGYFGSSATSIDKTCYAPMQIIDLKNGAALPSPALLPMDTIHSRGPCAAQGRFLYAVGHSTPAGDGRPTLIYDTVEPKFIERDPPAFQGWGGAYATPHGFVTFGEGRGEGHGGGFDGWQSDRVVMALARRFRARAQMYNAGAPGGGAPVDVPAASRITLANYEAKCTYRGCLESCRSDSDCVPFHYCARLNILGWSCWPKACAGCASCDVAPPDEPPPGDVIFSGRPYRMCLSAVCNDPCTREGQSWCEQNTLRRCERDGDGFRAKRVDCYDDQSCGSLRGTCTMTNGEGRCGCR